MKTAVSLPDELFQEADAEARRLGISRSELYGTALNEYLARRRTDAVTARLNEIYSKEDSSMDPVLYEMQFHSLDKEEW